MRVASQRARSADRFQRKRPQTAKADVNTSLVSEQVTCAWRHGTNAAVAAALHEVQASKEFREGVFKRVAECETQRKSVEGSVNLTIRQRLAETAKLHSRLESQMQRTNQDLTQLQNVQTDLAQRLRSADSHKNEAHQCLRRRAQRPARERVRDDAEELLEYEHEHIAETSEHFRKQLAQATKDIKKLAVHKERLECDIQDKRVASLVDQETLKMRERR